MKSNITTNDVRAYWESNPLYSLEVDQAATPEYFSLVDQMKKDTEVFTLEYFSFKKYQGKDILDIGCGPGWYVVQYGREGANVIGTDITLTATKLTKANIHFNKLKKCDVIQADAQRLPFVDNSFDVVVSTGVLHHLPDLTSGIEEAFRVLREGGEGKLLLYNKHIFLRNRLLFSFMLFIMRLLKTKHYDVSLGHDAKSPEEFVRMYDGRYSPLAWVKIDSEWRKELNAAGFVIEKVEVHYFPLRVFKGFWKFLFQLLHPFLDRNFGILFYYTLRRPMTE